MAIIAILVAVSIPLVSNSLERTRRATDAANERAAKAEAVIQYLSDNFASGDKYYNASTGKLVDAVADAGPAYGKCKVHANGCHIMVTMGTGDNAGDVTVKWMDKGGSPITSTHAGDVENELG